VFEQGLGEEDVHMHLLGECPQRWDDDLAAMAALRMVDVPASEAAAAPGEEGVAPPSPSAPPAAPPVERGGAEGGGAARGGEERGSAAPAAPAPQQQQGAPPAEAHECFNCGAPCEDDEARTLHMLTTCDFAAQYTAQIFEGNQ
jgi:hypothetical protein